MNAAIVHRGPDVDGLFVDGPIGLGMGGCRLSTWRRQLQSRTRMAASGLCRTAKSTIFANYGTIWSHVGTIFTRRVIQKRLYMPMKSGEDSILRATFAGCLLLPFGTESARNCGSRNRIGIKPIYYAETPAGLAFGSEVKSLLATSIVRPELEPRVLWQYFTYGNAGLEDSFVRGVRQLRPGCVLRFNGEHSKTRPYWELRIPKRRATQWTSGKLFDHSRNDCARRSARIWYQMCRLGPSFPAAWIHSANRRYDGARGMYTNQDVFYWFRKRRTQRTSLCPEGCRTVAH